MSTSPNKWKVWLAFGLVYVLWGSTYLAIRYSVQTIPPFLMSGVRYLTAGSLLYGMMRLRGIPAPTKKQWKEAAIIGAFLLLGGNGGLCWAEQRIPSGIAALLIGLVPLWMVLLDWIRRGGVRPRGVVFVGIAIGFAGIVLLVGPGQLRTGERLDPVAVAVVVFNSLSWAIGSLYARQAKLPSSSFLTTGMTMISGGCLLLLTGMIFGEAPRFHFSQITPVSWLSWGYLIIFGALIGFTAYTWVLKVTTAARASTYAYVNPVVAVFLGWLIAGEPLTFRIMMATGLIALGVLLIISFQSVAVMRVEKRKLKV